jgi:hypothetical protein
MRRKDVRLTWRPREPVALQAAAERENVLRVFWSSHVPSRDHLEAVTLYITAGWDVMPCTFVDGYNRFGGIALPAKSAGKGFLQNSVNQQTIYTASQPRRE